MTTTCRFFAPSEHACSIDPTLELPANYEFDRPFNYSACTNREVVGPDGFGGCTYETCQMDCPKYSYEAGTIVHAVIFKDAEANIPTRSKELLTVDMIREGIGNPSYQIAVYGLTNAEADAFGLPEILHYVDYAQHGANSKQVAMDLFAQEQSARAKKEPEELDVNGPVPFTCEGWAEVDGYVETVCQTS